MKWMIEEELPLIEAMKQYFPESSRRTHQNWIKWGRVNINGKIEYKGNRLLKKGEALLLKKKESLHQAMGIPILYEDRWIIVIDKPHGLLSVPAEKEKINAFHLLKIGFKTDSLFPVHRIDKETSGVLLFTRSKMAEERFNELFIAHDLDRHYLAIIEGHLPHKEGTWESYLREKENYDVEITSPELGKKAVTHYEVIRQSKKFSYLRFRLETGRKHQIRVQAAERGFPILGDKRYGSLINPFKRLALHAHTLSFIHPFTRKKMVFTSKPSSIFN